MYKRQRVLFALGIRFVGETVAKKIAKSFTDIEELENADLEKLKNIDEIGEKICLLYTSCTGSRLATGVTAPVRPTW